MTHADVLTCLVANSKNANERFRSSVAVEFWPATKYPQTPKYGISHMFCICLGRFGEKIVESFPVACNHTMGWQSWARQSSPARWGGQKPGVENLKENLCAIWLAQALTSRNEEVGIPVITEILDGVEFDHPHNAINRKPLCMANGSVSVASNHACHAQAFPSYISKLWAYPSTLSRMAVWSLTLHMQFRCAKRHTTWGGGPCHSYCKGSLQNERDLTESVLKVFGIMRYIYGFMLLMAPPSPPSLSLPYSTVPPKTTRSLH